MPCFHMVGVEGGGGGQARLRCLLSLEGKLKYVKQLLQVLLLFSLTIEIVLSLTFSAFCDVSYQKIYTYKMS